MPTAAMLLATLLWSSSLIGNKYLVAYLAVSEVVLTRFLLGAAVLWLAAMLTGQLRYIRQVGLRPILMGLIEPGLVGVLFVWGQTYTSAIHAAVFWALMPILMPVLGRIFLKESLEGIMVVSALIALCGTLLLVAGGASDPKSSVFGDMLCLLGVLFGCANQLIGRRQAQVQGRPVVTTAMQLLASAVLALGVMVLIERPQLTLLDQGSLTLAVMIYLGIFAAAGPFFLYNYALRHMPVGRISLFPPLVTPLGAGMAALVLGEQPSSNILLAIAIILFAVFLPNVWRRRAAA